MGPYMKESGDPSTTIRERSPKASGTRDAVVDDTLVRAFVLAYAPCKLRQAALGSSDRIPDHGT